MDTAEGRLMDTDELRALPIFAGLAESQLAELAEVASEVHIDAGQVVWREGAPADVWWVLLEGDVELLRQVAGEDMVVGAMRTPGQWAGGFAAWDPNALCFATGRSTRRGRALRVPSEQLHRLGEEWFAFGVHFIRGLVDTVRRVESTARQREALVALGTLAAGLAHELNNPASAATRAVDALESTSEALVAALGRLASRGVSSQQLAEVDGLRRGVVAPGTGSDPLEAADREDDLSSWLAERGVDQEWLVAPVLAAAGVDTAWCDRVESVLEPGALPAGIAW